MSKRIINPYQASSQAAAINSTQDLSDELGTFRLASAHSEGDLKSQASNVVLANLRVKFKTKTGVDVEHVIPVLVTHEEDQIKTYYSGADLTEADFLKFYQEVIPSVKKIERKSHYHSEPFLAYYLCSKQGKDFLAEEFAKKGLIVVGDDGEHYTSNIESISELSIDLHSTKVICFNCAPFLQAAQPQILRSINLALILPEEKRVGAINFNVSATTNLNSSNATGLNIFPHIPILEGNPSNILSRTEVALGEKESSLQKRGELQRTFFLSGSTRFGDDMQQLISTDKDQWDKIKNDAAIKIQQAWKKYKQTKNEDQELAELLGAQATISKETKPSPKPQRKETKKLSTAQAAAAHDSGEI